MDYAGLILSAQEYENFIGIIENNRCAQVWYTFGFRTFG